MEENVSDALLMAGAMLIFIVALTFSMSSFTTMRSTMQDIFEHDAKIDLVTDSSNNYLNYIKAGSDQARTVGVETVMSSIYRKDKENFKVYINTDKDLGIEKITLNSDKYNSKSSKNYMYEININTAIDYKELYGKLIEIKEFREYLGIYQDNSDVSSANKTTYRVITYVEV